MFKVIKSTLLVLSGVLAMSSCSKENAVEAPTKMSVTFSAGDNGEVEPEGEQSGNEGNSIYSVATAKTNYALEGWYDGDVKLVTGGDIVVSGNTLKVKLTAATNAKTYTANFQLATCQVTFASDDEGMGTVDPSGEQSGSVGDTISSVAIANTNYALEGWYDGDVKLVTGDDITVSGDTLNVTLTETTK
ncbi:MAG: InlB B-repeat-containing protein, partial [Phocaeicola sp.]